MTRVSGNVSITNTAAVAVKKLGQENFRGWPRGGCKMYIGEKECILSLRWRRRRRIRLAI
jgi:hypothetical protein